MGHLYASPIDLLGRDKNEQNGSYPLGKFFEDDKFISSSIALPLACGCEGDNRLNIQDIAQFPHLLVGGIAGSGKTPFLHAMLLGFFYRNSPADLKLFLVDTKGEFEEYHNTPHLAVPIITSTEKAVAALEWLCQEMIRRCTGMAEIKAIDIIRYNRALKEQGRAICPRLVFVVDELWALINANYYMTQELICRITQLGRAAGIHIIFSSQHITPDVYAKTIKANINSRIAFKTDSPLASQILSDCEDAIDLRHPREMLLAYSYSKLHFKMTSPYITFSEVVSIAKYLRDRYGSDYNKNIYAILNYFDKSGMCSGVTISEFTNNLIAALLGGSRPYDLSKYLAPSILVVDDFQHIAGKDSTQEEFYILLKR